MKKSNTKLSFSIWCYKLEMEIQLKNTNLNKKGKRECID